ncbi:hypothetical protein CANCADRAFT_56938 [Tortispora caseinolytica NRRL Y-17796]|uniref:RFX-type winged-helix domain-containing protein n=1 Tax=Tortispora caseinolytica NRRL Y-17796 TaxID=767744 RepID=A0A1E4TF83_9ASCO|nr:hypothetical protein CANCADRAFT_56938 [Tortispora caseinolytica NRRL Y-17796]
MEDLDTTFAIDPALGGSSVGSSAPKSSASQHKPSQSDKDNQYMQQYMHQPNQHNMPPQGYFMGPDFDPSSLNPPPLMPSQAIVGQGAHFDSAAVAAMQGQSVVLGAPASRRRRNHLPSEELERELRDNAENDLRLSIEQIASRVREEEGGPNAEKARQVFGMNWLMRHCIIQTNSAIPRSRIYNHYVNTCNAFQCRPLNPASFGKLVRVIFPDIKTRRLGIRGHSKYHYCGIDILPDVNPNLPQVAPHLTSGSTTSAGGISSPPPVSAASTSATGGAATSSGSVEPKQQSATNGSDAASVAAAAVAAAVIKHEDEHSESEDQPKAQGSVQLHDELGIFNQLTNAHNSPHN